MKKKKDYLDEVTEALMNNEQLVTMDDVDECFTALKGRLIQAMLEGEMDNHLGYKSNDKCEKTTENRRNGYSSKDKQVKTNNGVITVDMPRDRDGSFDPIIIEKRQRVLNNMDDAIIRLYAKGMSQRDIVEIVKETYKIEVSTSFISDVVSRVSDEVEAWRNRPLKPFYTFMYVDCLYCPIKEDLISVKRPIYVIIGIDINGKKEVVGIWIGDSTGEGAYFWQGIFEELKDRGVEDILYVSMDGLSGLNEAIESVYPRTQTQRCMVHLSRNLYKKCNKKDAKEIVQAFKKIYTAPNTDAALAEFENFKNKYKDKKKIVDTVDGYMQYILPLMELPLEIRKIIYTTNAIESVNSALRKVTNGKGAFPNEEALLKVLYLRVMDLEKKWKGGINNWDTVLNQLIQLFGERVTKYIDI